MLLLALVFQSEILAQFKPSDYLSHAQDLENINDGYSNLNPTVSNSGNELWFTKSSHPDNIGQPHDQDIWCSNRVKGVWRKPTNQIPGINTVFNDLIIGQSEGNKLFILQYMHGLDDQLTEIKAFRKSDEQFVLDHKIQIPRNHFLGEFFGFFVAQDESFIILSMKGEFSFGKEDLYVMLNQNGKWSSPLHLGARINTSGFEMSPYMANDGLHLFFSSEGHNSYGSGDIFVSSRLDDTWQNWSKPINLGPNINTPNFEAYFTLDELNHEGYFVTNRNKQSGSIMKVSYKNLGLIDPQSVHPAASGFIRLEKLPAINVKLSLLDENDEIIQSVTTNDEGYFNLQSFLPDKDYKIVIDDSVRSELQQADIFLTNDLGDKMVFMNEREMGIFGFKVLSGQKVEEVERFEKMASAGKIVDKSTTIKGKVATFGTLNEQIKLNVVDQNNEIVETIETDKDGYFSFSTNAQEKSYFLSVDENTQGLVDVYEIFLTNDNPNEDIIVTKTDKHLFEFRSLSDGSSDGLRLLAEHDKSIPKGILQQYGLEPSSDDVELTGFLRFDKLPMINAEISLLDENEKLLDKTMTDSEGRFVFKDALLEGNYSLKLDDSQETDLQNSEIFLARNPQEILFYMNDSRSGVFAFKKLAAGQPMTPHSLKTQTESGAIVSETEGKLKGKFEYKKLPKSVVKLQLLDQQENVIQVTKVKENGEFEFERYMVNQNYFISVEGGSGLSDIYQIYLSGQQKNVLVNQTDKYVFVFKVLPSQDIVLTQSYEQDAILPRIGGSETERHAKSKPRENITGYYEYDLSFLRESQFAAFDLVINELEMGRASTIRISKEEKKLTTISLKTITDNDLNEVKKALRSRGLAGAEFSVNRNGSDQILITIKK
jgi:hypothetical protein